MNNLLCRSPRGRVSVASSLAVLFASLLLCPSIVAAEQEPPTKATADWPQFLGPQRNGISSETGLITTWPAAGPPIAWRAAAGTGMSGVVVSRGRAVTMLHREGQQCVAAWDAVTGQSVWSTPVAPEYRNGMGNGPRATPVISGDTVLAFSGEGILVALNFKTGKPIWSQNVVEQLGGEIAEYGMAASPLVVDQQVIVTVGAPAGAIAAFDIGTGKLAWKSGTGAAGYSSPTLLDVGGRSQIVATTGTTVFGLQPKTGAVLWEYPFETNYNCNIATPLSVKGQVFISAGENHGSVLLNLKPQDDQFVATEVWSSLGTKSVLRNEWQTSILHDGYLYGFDNVGAAGPVTHLTCINAETGARAWQQLRFGKGNLIAADGKLFISTMNGELVIVRLSPKAFEELGRMEILGSTRQAPALSNGRLYLRDDKEIVCVDVRKK